MEGINAWINCILATVILIGLVEIIVPEGEIRRFVFLVTGVITSIIIATPVIKFFSEDFSLNNILSVDMIENNFYYIDTLRSTVDKQSAMLEEVFSESVIKKFNELYFDMEISECEISFFRDADGKIIEINEVIVKPSKKIDDISLLKRRIADICEVDSKKVRVS